MALQVISAKKMELETGRGSSAGKTSERIRSKRLRGGQSMSAITSALKYEDEEEDEEAEGMEEDDSDQEDDDDDDDENEDEESSPLWTLFDAVSTFTNNTGYSLSDPFRKLPSKRFYPDYYKEIKNPISLFQIRTKLKVVFY
jgi:protein polybromo-1